SLKHIENYLNIEQEVKLEPSGEPPAYWPASGDLRVEKLSAKYSPDGPEVLHELTFHIKSGKHIGVGMHISILLYSLLTLSLLCCICTSGDIFYDGLSINKMNLEALRTQITIIPQIPELISGSLRENLDPFEEHNDFMLNNALKLAGLQALQEDMPEKDRIMLDTLVSSGGTNFSLGQQQIIALARAIVCRSKLLILDKGYFCPDYKTDSIASYCIIN
ncbi:P-loop containing nucleoside triphosphate hydrolase protein, partial [Gymnopus androsaceus JB14]